MIIVDNKELNLSVAPPKKGDPAEVEKRWESLSENERWVIEQFIELRKLKKVILKDPKPMDQMRMIQKAPTSFDLSGTRVNPTTGVQEKWLFTTQRPTISKTGDKEYKADRISFFNRINFNTQKSVDKVFFLINIVDEKQFGLIIENTSEEAKKRIEERKTKAEAQTWLFEKCTDDDIYRLAQRYNVSDIKDKDSWVLRDEMFEMLNSGELRKDKKLNFAHFLEELNSESEVVELAAKFNQAVNAERIRFVGGNTRVCTWDDNVQIGGTIPPERFKMDRNEYIIDWLIKHPEDKDIFLKTLNAGQEEQLRMPDENEAMVITHSATLRKWAKENLGGVDIGMVSLDEGKKKVKQLITEYRQKIQEAQVTV